MSKRFVFGTLRGPRLPTWAESLLHGVKQRMGKKEERSKALLLFCRYRVDKRKVVKSTGLKLCPEVRGPAFAQKPVAQKPSKPGIPGSPLSFRQLYENSESRLGM